MRHTILYIYCICALAASLLTGCSQEDGPALPKGSGTLSLELHRVGIKAETRAVSDGLAVKIVASDGKETTFAPGETPERISLEPGAYTLYAYTDNQDTWQEDNNGKGSACHWGSTTFTIEEDNVTRVSLMVPMTNYAVSLTLPSLFEQLFLSHSLTLACGDRKVSICQGEKAYFDPALGGFSYMLSATNTDQVTHSTATVMYREVGAGNCYNLTYYYDTTSNSGGIDIEIKDNMETEDENKPI